MGGRGAGVAVVTWDLAWRVAHDFFTDEPTGGLDGVLVARNVGDRPVRLGQPGLRRLTECSKPVPGRTIVTLDYRALTEVPPGGSAASHVTWNQWDGTGVGNRFEIECGPYSGTTTATGPAHPAQRGVEDQFSSGWFTPGSRARSADDFDVPSDETTDTQRAALIDAVGGADAVLRRAIHLLERRRHSEAKMLLAETIFGRDALGNSLRRYRQRPTGDSRNHC